MQGDRGQIGQPGHSGADVREVLRCYNSIGFKTVSGREIWVLSAPWDHPAQVGSVFSLAVGFREQRDLKAQSDYREKR